MIFFKKMFLLTMFSFSVEAYKKGIMKGGSSIPPPSNIPGSKFSSIT